MLMPPVFFPNISLFPNILDQRISANHMLFLCLFPLPVFLPAGHIFVQNQLLPYSFIPFSFMGSSQTTFRSRLVRCCKNMAKNISMAIFLSYNMCYIEKSTVIKKLLPFEKSCVLVQGWPEDHKPVSSA